MIAAVIQARMNSTRLPGKVMMELAGEPLLFRVVERVCRARLVQEVVVATSTDASDEPIVEMCERRGVRVYRGPLNDVLARYLGAAQACGADTIVRVTSDCPLIDPSIIDGCIEQFSAGSFDYASNTENDESSFPRGLDVEVFSASALEIAAAKAHRPYERENVTPYIWENRNAEFTLAPPLAAPERYRAAYRLTVDYPEDLALMRHIYDTFYTSGNIVSVPDVIAYLDAHPEWASVNAHCEQKPIRTL